MLAHRARLAFSCFSLALLLTLACSKKKAASSKVPPAQLPVLVVFPLPGMAAHEVESQVTYPAVTSILSLAGVEDIESLSMDSSATLAVTFANGSDVFENRAKLRDLSWTGLPTGVHAVLPPASKPRPVAVYQIASESLTPVRLRAVQDQSLYLPVVTLPGVSHVSICGGAIAELQVEVETEKSTAYGIALSTVASQARSFTEFSSTENSTESIETLSKMVVAKKNDSPVFLQDIATVRLGIEFPTCLASSSGIPMVEVQVFAAPDADSHVVAAAVKEAVESHIPSADVELAWTRAPDIRVAVEIANAGATESNSRQLQDALHEVARRIERYPGIETVSIHAGTPDNGTAARDGADAELRVFLSSDSDAAVLAAKIEAEVDLPSIRLRSRVPETSEMASMTNWVRVYGPELNMLGTLAVTLQTSLRALQTVQSTHILSLRELSRPSFTIKREAAARLGISVHDIREALLAANEGLMIRPPGTRHTAIRFKVAGMETPQELARHSIMTPRGAVPLGQLFSIELGMAPAIIRARNTRRYVEVQYSASGNDNEIRAAIAKSVQLPAQYELEWRRAP